MTRRRKWRLFPLWAALLSATLLGCPLPGMQGTWTIKAMSMGPSGAEREEYWVFTFSGDAVVKWEKEGYTAAGRYSRDKNVITISGTFRFGGGGGTGTASWRLNCALVVDEESLILTGPFNLTLITPHPGNDTYTGTIEAWPLDDAEYTTWNSLFD
ncbi:MAG TPA: hypothetical protein ENN80_07405 [Candidatus Hydrogenedentes bacterium]|nr:hypothetical protein [Candidatus Hydrogenedentota bacterium]